MLDPFRLMMIALRLFLPPAMLIPLLGTLVRFRARYNPKSLQLDSEGDVQPHTGPIISSFFGMLRRVYRIEGWPGLYKGFMPLLMLTTLFFMIFLSSSNLHHSAPGAGIVGVLHYIYMLVYLPQVIIMNRAITTPYKLPYFNVISSLRILLTPTERRRPWILYLTPGLLTTQVACIAYFKYILRSIQQLLDLPILLKPGILLNPGFRVIKENVSLVKLVIFFIIALLSTVMLTPLEVIVIRLSIQRNHAAPEFNSILQEEDGDAEEAAEYSGTDEDVIGLRTDREPYVGLVDCAKRIISEEGWSVLYRAWWLTTLGNLTLVLS